MATGAEGADVASVSDLVRPSRKFLGSVVVVLAGWFIAAFLALFTGLTGGSTSSMFDVGLILLGVLLLAAGVYSIVVISAFRKAPMTVTKAGVFLPGWSLRFSRRTSSRFIPFARIVEVRVDEDGGWFRVTFSTVEGSQAVSYCREAGVVQAIERFVPKGALKNGPAA